MQTPDDWKSEIEHRLNESAIFKHLSEESSDGAVNTHAKNLIYEITSYCHERTKTIVRHMGEFTLHDSEHLFRVLNLMERLIGAENIKYLSTADSMLLVLSAFLHDIGMAPCEKDVIAWKKIWDSTPSFANDQEKEEYESFKKFHASRPDENTKLKRALVDGELSKVELAKHYLISEYIRSTHTERARTIIENDWMGKIRFRDTDLTVELAKICFSHNEEPLKILEFDRNHLCGPNCSTNLQLVAVLLRLADILDFDAKRTPTLLMNHLFVRNATSLIEWQKHRTVEAWRINPDEISFQAKCQHPAIEAAIHDFCDIIDTELVACRNIISTINDYNRKNNLALEISVPLKVDRSKISTQTDIRGDPLYIYKEARFNLEKNQVVDLLMGTKLYGNPEVALRELLQNSIDACLLRDSLEKSWGNPYEPEILVKYYNDGTNNILEVRDNGTGMDEYIIKNYYSKVGSSFYKSSDFYQLKFDSHAEFTPTSRFGIGILSSFMVSDTIEVNTRRIYGPHESSEPWNISIEGYDSIFWIRHGSKPTPGTETKLVLRSDDNPWARMSDSQFIESVERTIRNPPFRIIIEGNSERVTRDRESYLQSSAEELANHSWSPQNFIKTVNINLASPKDGFVGSAIVAVLEERDTPRKSISRQTREVEVEGTTFPLRKRVSLRGKEISVSASSITIDEDGDIEESDSSSYLFQSISEISLHGIRVEATLFPEPWKVSRNQPILKWPLPVLLSVDVCGSRDLELNSSRDQFILGKEWHDFERALTTKIFSELARELGTSYWQKLKTILMQEESSEIFRSCIEKVGD